MYTKKDFARELEQEIIKNFDTDRLSAWAHDKYLDHAKYLDKETYDAIMTIVFMSEEGFEISKIDLLKLAAEWQQSI